jgi:hypothetical protein
LWQKARTAILVHVMISLRALAILVFVLAFAAPASAAPPSNDGFDQAAPLGDPPVAVPGTVAEATRESGEPRHAGAESPETVWYVYRPRQSSTVALDTCDSTFDTVLAVYRGSSLNTLGEVGSNDDLCRLGSRVRFAATAGETYWIAVASLATRTGESAETPTPLDFRLRLSEAPRPANDAFVRAKSLRLFDTISGETWDATKELGEPRHGPSGKSVWFRYRARRSEQLIIDTAGSQFDTVLAVYRGRSVNALRLVAQDDDGGGDVTSQVRFAAKKGVTYYVALDGFGVGGGYTLSLRNDGVRGMGLSFIPEEGQTLATAARDGLLGMVGCARACRVKVDALVSRDTARRLGLHNRVLGTTGGELDGGDPELATITLTRQARRALRNASTDVAVTLRVELVGSRSADRTLTRRITLSPAS